MKTPHTHTDIIENTAGLFEALGERKDRLAHLWRMKPSERLAAFYRGDLNQEELYAWAVRCPNEVPQINGEFAFIAATCADNGVTCPVCGDDEVMINVAGNLVRHPDRRHPRINDHAAIRSGIVPRCPVEDISFADAAALATTTPVLDAVAA